jgi:prepilin-type N-terminal cleavage/methylation domain-containing protein
MIENNKIKGFSVLELIVSLALFSLALTIIMTILFALVDTQNEAVNTQNVQDNIRFAFDTMVRDIRTGREFHCGAGDVATPANCPAGGSSLTIFNQANQRITYQIFENQLVKSSDGSSDGVCFPDPNNRTDCQRLTAPGVIADRLTFFVRGALADDDAQSLATVVLRGRIIDPKGKASTEINLQATMSRRGLVDRP